MTQYIPLLMFSVFTEWLINKTLEGCQKLEMHAKNILIIHKVLLSGIKVLKLLFQSQMAGFSSRILNYIVTVLQIPLRHRSGPNSLSV